MSRLPRYASLIAVLAMALLLQASIQHSAAAQTPDQVAKIVQDKVKIGMTKGKVKALTGEPDIHLAPNPPNDKAETWLFGDNLRPSAMVEFGPDGRVVQKAPGSQASKPK